MWNKKGSDQQSYSPGMHDNSNLNNLKIYKAKIYKEK